MIDDLLVETATNIFADTCTHAAVENAEADGWAPTVWEPVATAGLPWVGVPEAAGGVGGTTRDAVAILVVAGRYSAPIPLAETGLLAGWLLAEADLLVPEGPVTVVPGRPGDDLSIDHGALFGTATRVPWARSARHVVALVGGEVVSVPTAGLHVVAGTNLAGEPRDTVVFDGARPVGRAAAPAGLDRMALTRRGALGRSALMSGALQGLAELTAHHAANRIQFGRPIVSFQAVQTMVVQIAEQAALVDLAVQVAARELGPFEIASAKQLANQAARRATAAAHQAHGALGMTREHGLQHLTRRLWSWRAEFGDGQWTRYLGTTATRQGPAGLYPLIAGGSAALATHDPEIG